MSLLYHLINILHLSRKPRTNFKGTDNPYMRAINTINSWMRSTVQMMISSYMLEYEGPNAWISRNLLAYTKK